MYQRENGCIKEEIGHLDTLLDFQIHQPTSDYICEGYIERGVMYQKGEGSIRGVGVGGYG